jgi:hypothetical protein
MDSEVAPYVRMALRKAKGSGAPKGKTSRIDLTDKVALEYYTNKKTFEGSLSLSLEDGTEPLTPVKFVGVGKKKKKRNIFLPLLNSSINALAPTLPLRISYRWNRLKKILPVIWKWL